MRRLLSIALMCFIVSACTAEVSGPEPKMTDSSGEEMVTDPSFVCNEDPGTWVTLYGEDFSPLVIDAIAKESDHDVEIPTVMLTRRADPSGDEVDESSSVTLESPLGVAEGSVRWISDREMMFYVSDELELEPGVYDIEVENPNGGIVTEHEAVGVLPRPTLEAAIPEMTCIAQADRQVSLEGQNFLISGDEYPTVIIEGQDYEVVDVDDCHDLHEVFGDHQLCSQATTRIDEASLEAGTFDVVIENLEPANCPSRPEEDEVTLTIADPPEVHDIQPSPICGEQLDYESVEIDGQGFVILGQDDERVYPEVRIGDRSYQPESAGGCEVVDEAPSMDAQRCSSLTVSIAADDFASAIDESEWVTQLGVEVENPDPVGCHSTEDTTLGVVPPPTITAVAPRAFCNNDGTVTFDVDGDHLFEVDGDAPTVVIDSEDYETVASDCTDIDGETATRACERLKVDVDPEHLEGAYAMVAINPEPMACESDDSEQFYAAGPPVIDSAEPDGFCDDAEFDGELEIFGQFLNDPQGDPIIVEVAGEEIDFTLHGCSAVIDDFDLELCGRIEPVISASMVDQLEDDFTVTVTGGDPVACGEATITLERTEPPTIDSIVPLRVCADGGTTFTVTGSGIHEDAEFLLNDVAAAEEDVDIVDDTEAVVTFSDSIPGDWATFEVINPGDCGTIYEEEEIRVTDGPLPIFVDPPVVFNGMNTQVTIYAAGLFGGAIDEVALVHPDGESTVLDHSIDSERPNVVQATIPEAMLGLLAEEDLSDDGASADFGIRLTDEEISCSNQTDDLITITDELTIALESIDPPFGAQDQSSGVEIRAASEISDDETQFEATPRAYLNPVSDDVGSLGREIRALQFNDETDLSGIVPSGLSVGLYDLIVVNPAGTVGVLEDAFQITEERPPLVDSVSPASWPNDQTALSVDVEGDNFRSDATVEVFCRQSGDDETDESELDQPSNITVVGVSDDMIELEVNTGNLDALSACYMRVSNTDGTFAEYSPITTTNPAEKFLEFQPGNAFNTARRAPTAFAGAASRAARYLYVIGGDEGASEDGISTGEFTRLDRFGAPGTWRELTYELPSGRSFSDGVRIDDFLYLVGGSDEGESSDEVLRAQILDPLDVPEIVNIDLEVEQILGLEPDEEPPSGLEAGTYYYRVAAVYSSDDPANPGGESLASEPQPVQLPIDGVNLTISWDPPEHINHDIEFYNIYRNVNPDDPYGNESLIEIVDATEFSYTDDGSDEPIDGDNPLPLGSLSTWHQVSTLNHARQKAGITFAPSPDQGGEYFIYAIGGEDVSGDFRDDYEFITVEVDGARDQFVGAATMGLDDSDDEMVMPAPRAELTAALAYESNAAAVADVAPQIFVYGGSSDGSTDTNIKVTTVGDDGHLEDWTTFAANQRMSGGQRSGHAGAVLNNNLVYAGGGSGGAPGNDGFHAEILCGGDCPPASIPSSFSNLSDLNMQSRAWMGQFAFRGFWYLAGGNDGSGPLNTIDYSIAGATP